jgi:arylsulfatase A-like enzyme
LRTVPAATAFVLACLAASCTPATPAPPSVVLVVIDDLGWADLGSFGSRVHRTPNADRLAREGVRFTRAYANGPNCSPARASLLTGQYPPRHGIYNVYSQVRPPGSRSRSGAGAAPGTRGAT